MADDDPNDLSPWARDDWVAESAVPDPSVFSDRRPDRSTPTAPTAPSRPSQPAPPPFADGERSAGPAARTVAAVAIAAALVVGAGVAIWQGVDSGDAAPPVDTDVPTETDVPTDTDVPADTSSAAGLPTTAPNVEDGEDGIAPATTVGGGAPSAVTAGQAVPAIEDGQVADWAERTIAVPEPLATIAPTEVVTLSREGILSVTEFPSGRSRSIDVSSIGTALQMTMGEGTILLFAPNAALQLRDGELPVLTALPDGIIFAQPWTGTGRFVLTTPATGPTVSEKELVLDRDGSLSELDGRLADESDFFWSRTFSPTGAALVSRPGGVYSIDPTGAIERISTGHLLATGTRHWAIEECDEALRCAYSVVSWETGEVTRADLDAIARRGYLDPATHISPDGRSITHRFDADGPGRRMILDVATGDEITAGVASQFVYPDAWAADSSGLFVADPDLAFVDRTTGAVTEITDLGRVDTVATGPFAG